MRPEDLAALHRVDLNLLRAFDALMSERSVTLAAARLSLGQPAMSAALGRLRRLFNDPLLVREGAVLEPTPVALGLHPPIARALARIQDSVNTRRSFDPLSDTRTFTVIASDHVILLMLMPLLRALRTEAPGVRLRVLPLVPDHVGQIRRNQVDLVIAPRDGRDLSDAVLTSDLMRDRFVCAVADDHPEVEGQVTVEQFDRYPYLGYDDDPSAAVLRRHLRAQGVERSLDVRTQSHVMAALMLEGTEMVSILPGLLAERFAHRAAIRVVDPPVALPDLTETLHWSPLQDKEPAHAWLRQRLSVAARELDSSRLTSQAGDREP
jgi:DNA-binding transcriptional LysR family regulator